MLSLRQSASKYFLLILLCLFFSPRFLNGQETDLPLVPSPSVFDFIVEKDGVLLLVLVSNMKVLMTDLMNMK